MKICGIETKCKLEQLENAESPIDVKLDILNVDAIFSGNGQNECHEVRCDLEIDLFDKLEIYQKFKME